MVKNFFKNEKERLLWIRLNAERIQYAEKVLKYNNKLFNDFNIHLQTSLNQLSYDEHRSNAPRFSFVELVLPHDELLKLEKRRNSETVKKMLGEIHGFTMLGDIEDEEL